MITREYQVIDDIKVFDNNIIEEHRDYNAQGLDNLYQAEEYHFWFIARKEFIFSQIKNIIEMTSNIIEIGAGTGNVSRYLQSHGCQNLCVGELHLNGLKYAKSYGIETCYQFDLLKSPFQEEFDGVCMFDVLEHIENNTLALQNVHTMLKSNGKIILTVPAHMWLWNRDDAIAGHKTRYTKKRLNKILEEAGFEIIISRYFFIFIVPLLWLRRLLNRDHHKQVIKEEYTQKISINPIINTILLFITRIENKLNNFLPNMFGGSLLIIARKK
ncbi:MAG: class I SAM-dependent methyltransferase [Campylobacterota bacterium]